MPLQSALQFGSDTENTHARGGSASIALDQRRQSLSSVIKSTPYPAALTMARPSSARRATNNDAAQSKVAFLNEAWGGEAWMPEDVRAAMFNKNKRAGNQVVGYLARITKLAQKQDISLSSLWLPGGSLRDAVDRGPNAPRLTGDLAKEVYERMKENAVPAVHSTDPSVYSEDDLIHEEDTVDEDLPQTPLKKPRVRSAMEVQLSANKFGSAEYQERSGILAREASLLPEMYDELAALESPTRKSTDVPSKSSPAEIPEMAGAPLETIKEASTQSGPEEDEVDERAPSPPASTTSNHSPSLSKANAGHIPAAAKSDSPLLSATKPKVESPSPFVKTETQRTNPNQHVQPFSNINKRKRDQANQTPESLDQRPPAKRFVSGPDAEKIYHQLTSREVKSAGVGSTDVKPTGVRFTDDVLDILCQVVVAKNGKENVRMLHPLWFEADETKALPQELRQIKSGDIICFLIHHRNTPKHWTLGVVRVSTTEMKFHFHDSAPQADRAITVAERFKAWMKKCGFKQELSFHESECPRQQDKVSCGAFALACLKHELENKPCPESVDPEHVKRHLLWTLQTADDDLLATPAGAAAIRDLRKLPTSSENEGSGQQKSLTNDGNRVIQQLNPVATQSVPSTPFRSLVLGSRSDIGAMLADFSLETLNSKLNDAEFRLHRAMDQRDQARDTLSRLKVQEDTIIAVCAYVSNAFDARGIDIDSAGDNAISFPTDGDEDNQMQRFEKRGLAAMEFMQTSYREGAGHAQDAVHEFRSHIAKHIEDAHGSVEEKQEEIEHLRKEVAHLKGLCKVKESMQLLSSPDCMGLLMSMQGQTV
ncbi:hypothetical protein FALBO_5909 [Fusarium albosuccineum]|uniref:Ubiquitin-like protease family profile domain-containing protein n=1 Tax=Fusarium albosuccineum TaxID=1237068 RepID=A0A8H4LFV6_9HYPO|nr:hypothetical protein FALBO_5909 [Fusarium albosuccineum]